MRDDLTFAFAMSSIALACGGSSESTSNAATSGDIARYRENAQAVRASAVQYEATMAGDGVTSTAACQQVHDQYDATVRPTIIGMQSMSDSMDAFMNRHGGGAMADIGCAGTAMMAELDRHHSVACQLSDLALDRAEAIRHAEAVTTYADHLSERSDQMMGAVSDSPASWSPMMAGCRGMGGMNMMHAVR